jgi:tetratricopeptide (TPR) repeat protein
MKYIKQLFSIGNTNPDQSIKANSINNSIVIQKFDVNNGLSKEFAEQLSERLKNLETMSSFQSLKIQEMSEINQKSSDDTSQLYSRLMNNTINEIKTLIDDGKVRRAQKIINEIMETVGFAQIDKEHIAKIYYYNGLIFLNDGRIDKCRDWVEKITELDQDSYFRFNLQYKISVQNGDDELFNESIKSLERISSDQNEVKLKKLFYEITKGNYTVVIDELSELGNIKMEFENNPDALYYLGLAFFQTENYISAQKYFNKSNQIQPLKYKLYLTTLCDIIPIINRRGVLYLLTEAQKQSLKAGLERLIEIKDFFADKHISLREEFWGTVLNVKFYLNPSEIINDVEDLSDDLKNTDSVQLMLADAYSIVGPFEKAEELHKMLYEKNKNPELLVKIITRLESKKDFAGILQFLEGIAYPEYDVLGDVIGSYITAFSKLNIFPATEQLINSIESYFYDAPLFYRAVALIMSEHDELPNRSIEYMEKAISVIQGENESIRMYISDTCESLNYTDQAIKVLLPLEKSVTAKESILRLCLQDENNEAKLELAEEMATALIDQGVKNLNIHNAKAEIAIRKKQPQEALKQLTESFAVSPTVNSAYNIVAIKMSINDKHDLQFYIDYLSRTDNSRANMLSASASDFIGSRAVAEELAYKALKLLETEFDESIYLQFAMLYMVSKNRKDDENIKIEFEKVEPDTVIELIDNSGIKRFICIESNPALIKEEGVVFLGVEHYSTSSPISIKLLKVEVNLTVILDSIEYYVRSIINKHVFAFRKVCDTYIERCPDSPYLRAIKITPDDPFTSLIPYLESDRKNHAFLMEQYNFGNGIGLPISTLCEKDYFKYPSAMFKLFQSKNQVYYAGDINRCTRDKPFVLSFSSIILMKIIGVLNIVKSNKEQFKVTYSLVKKVESLFEEAVTTRVAATMSIDQFGRPIYTTITDQDKEGNIEFWRDILLTLQEIETIKDVEEHPFKNKAVSLIDGLEIDSISASYQIGAQYLSDDLFLTKVANFMYDSLQTSNTIPFLFEYLEADELLDKIVILTSYKYHQCLKTELLLQLINDCILSKTIVYGQGTNMDKFTLIIKNIISHPQLLTYYLVSLIEIVYFLYDKKIDQRAEELLHYVIRDIVISSRQFKINLESLIKLFLSPSGLDFFKADYIRNVFRKF